MTSLSAYLDDSQQDGVYVVAGYIGHREMWSDHFIPAWQSVLAAAPHPVSEFKSSDCRQMVREFSPSRGWTRSECDLLTRQVVSVIAEAPENEIVGVGMAVSFRDLPSAYRGDDGVFTFTFQLCLTALFHDILDIARNFLGDSGEIEIILDEQDGHHAHTQERFTNALERLEITDQRQFRAPIFATSHSSPPLQAADLLAYETGKELRNREASPPRVPSKALSRLLSSRFHMASFVDRAWLEEAWPQDGNPPRDPDNLPAMPRIYDSREPLRGRDS